jgi:orotate phosphoribosyltransferase
MDAVHVPPGGEAASRQPERALTSLRQQVIEIVRTRGLLRLPEPVVLASGELSRDFIDGKAALARGADLKLACEALLESLGEIDFDAVGGLTMGADQFAHVVAVLTDRDWFVVRKEPKGRGTNKLVEGAQVGAGTRVLLVDDVVTTGGSIHKAYDAISALGATVVAAVTLVDRGEVAARFFREQAIPYFPLVTYGDLGIEPLGGGLVRS